MQPIETLILIGLRGTGKTTVGQLVAAARRLPFVDVDAQLQATTGQSVRQLFASIGEAGFRELEAALLAQLLERATPQVIATGGGAVLRADNRQRIRAAGWVVWLTADPAVLAERLAADAATAEQRPALLAGGGLAEMLQLAAAREPLYRECADLIVPTDSLSPQQVAEHILSAWNSNGLT
jgi:shikimate kinase